MRRLFYINPKIQFAFSGFMAGLFAVELMVAEFLIVLVEKYLSSLPGDYQFYLRFGALFILLLISTAVNLFLGARISHRIAGPLVQIQRTLEKARRGDYSARVQTRTTDYLQEVSAEINALLQRFEILQNSSHNSPTAEVQVISNLHHKSLAETQK